MHKNHKGRELTPENIKETISVLIDYEHKEIDSILVSEEVHNTINDFKVYFKKARSYKIICRKDVPLDYIELKTIRNG